jgi:thymidine phosphorylase
MTRNAFELHGGEAAAHSSLRSRRLGIHTHDEAVVFMRTDCHVCKSEGFSARAVVLLRSGEREIPATLYQVSGDLLAPGEAGLSEAAWRRLDMREGGTIAVRHPDPIASLSHVRSRVYGHRLDGQALHSIVHDVAAGRYSDVQLASFITACSALPLDETETIALTRAMVAAGERLFWASRPVVDKHSVGGLPGNRTTPIVVAIAAAHGLTIPKTSSRAITSPAGTADTMETLAPVELGIGEIRRVVEREQGCVVWGGAVKLSPADDIMIRIERALELDAEGQLVASVLSKKIAAGASHLVLDVPVGATAKVRSAEAGRALASRLTAVASAFGLQTRIILSDGTQPVGRGIGPALEARDILAVLQGSPEAPQDLSKKACDLAGALLEMAARAGPGEGAEIAQQTITDGRAARKFQRICEAQGGMRTPPVAPQQRPLLARRSGRIATLNNRKLAKLAKLAGAPDTKAAGVELHVRLSDTIGEGDPLCTVHAGSRGELAYALDYAMANDDIIGVGLS